MFTEQNKAIVRRFFDEVCNNRKTDLIPEIFDEKVNFNGKPGCHNDVVIYLEKIKESFDNPHVEINLQLAEADRVSTKRTWTGIQNEKYNDYPSTGKLMTWTEISVVRLLNGKIVDDWVVQGELKYG